MLEPYYSNQFATIYHGDSREIVKLLDFDCIITDPPYGIGLKTNYKQRKRSGLAQSGRDARNRRIHPTQKPVELMQRIIGLTTGTVLDPYMGSGTTLLAAQELERQTIGIEFEEQYCEIAAKRLG